MKAKYAYLVIAAGCVAGYFWKQKQAKATAQKTLEEQSWWDWLWTPIGQTAQLKKEAR